MEFGSFLCDAMKSWQFKLWFLWKKWKVKVNCTVVSDSLPSHGLYSLPGSSVHGILQARVPEWLPISFSRWSSYAFSRSSLYIWKFSVHVLLKPSLKDFEYYLASMRNECNCRVVWAFFVFAHLWDWNENWHFPVLWPLLSFPNLLTYWVQHFNIIF